MHIKISLAQLAIGLACGVKVGDAGAGPLDTLESRSHVLRFDSRKNHEIQVGKI
jgi:hypothetical protein